MDTIFIEVFFSADSLADTDIEGRDEIEDPLHDALQEAGIGEVTGGGGGVLGSNIDVEVSPEHFDEALALIKQVLKEVGAPATTTITRYEPEKIIYRLDE